MTIVDKLHSNTSQRKSNWHKLLLLCKMYITSFLFKSFVAILKTHTHNQGKQNHGLINEIPTLFKILQ